MINWQSGQRWSNEEIKIISDMAKLNYTDREIGKKLGRSRAAVAMQRKKLNVTKPDKYVNERKRWGRKDTKTLIEMKLKGCSDEEISKMLGRTVTSIKRKWQHHIEKQDETHYRAFNGTTDKLLVMLTNEDNASPAYIGWLLNRDAKEVENRIKELRESGKFDEIHNYLTSDECNGIYAIKMRRLNKGRGA